MALYSVICDYKQGTYIRQIRAASVHEAVQGWIERIEPAEIPGIGTARKSALLNRCRGGVYDRPVPVSACDQVWCWSCDGVLLHIVRTFDPAHDRRKRDSRREIEEREDKIDIAAVRLARREQSIPLSEVKRRLSR